MTARVFMVRPEPVPDHVEPVVAGDGEAALELLRREPFDAVVVDLALAPLDSWCVLAAVGARTGADRPTLVALVPTADDLSRALLLGADSCAPSGTPVDARALQRAPLKEMPCPQPPATSSRRPTTAGASV